MRSVHRLHVFCRLRKLAPCRAHKQRLGALAPKHFGYRRGTHKARLGNPNNREFRIQHRKEMPAQPRMALVTQPDIAIYEDQCQLRQNRCQKRKQTRQLALVELAGDIRRDFFHAHRPLTCGHRIVPVFKKHTRRNRTAILVVVLHIGGCYHARSIAVLPATLKTTANGRWGRSRRGSTPRRGFQVGRWRRGPRGPRR